MVDLRFAHSLRHDRRCEPNRLLVLLLPEAQRQRSVTAATALYARKVEIAAAESPLRRVSYTYKMLDFYPLEYCTVNGFR